MWHCCCDTVVVTLLMWHCCCDTVVVTLLLWPCWCDTVVVTLLLWHCWCDTVVVTLLLWHCCCWHCCCDTVVVANERHDFSYFDLLAVGIYIFLFYRLFLTANFFLWEWTYVVCAGTYGCFCLCLSRLSCVGAAQRPVLIFLYITLLRTVSRNFTEHQKRTDYLNSSMFFYGFSVTST